MRFVFTDIIFGYHKHFILLTTDFLIKEVQELFNNTSTRTQNDVSIKLNIYNVNNI